VNISVSEASKRWGVSRTTIYKKIDDGELSRNSDKKIDTTEMLRVFGNPPNTERTEQKQNNVHWTPVNSEAEQENIQLRHQLDIEKLKNDHLHQELDQHKALIESYQKQIEQLIRSLDKANTSIQDFAQTKLLEMKAKFPVETPFENQGHSREHTGNTDLQLSKVSPNVQSTHLPEVEDNNKKKKWWNISI